MSWIDVLLEAYERLLEFTPFAAVLALGLGLIFGSFLNVVIYRWPLQRSVVLPGSGCGSCGTPLGPAQNLPVLSYLLQRGMCHFCGAPFSARYAAIEALCGAASVGLLWLDGGFGWLWLAHFTLFLIALAVFWTDVDHWIIPDELNLFGVLFGLGIAHQLPARGDMELLGNLFSIEPSSVLLGNTASSLLGVVVGWLFFKGIQVFGLVVARQEAMGEGDVKYAAVLGAFLGWQGALMAFLLSFFLGAAYAVPLMLTRKNSGKDPVPFGTFMSLAALPVALGSDWLWAFAWRHELY